MSSDVSFLYRESFILIDKKKDFFYSTCSLCTIITIGSKVHIVYRKSIGILNKKKKLRKQLIKFPLQVISVINISVLPIAMRYSMVNVPNFVYLYKTTCTLRNDLLLTSIIWARDSGYRGL